MSWCGRSMSVAFGISISVFECLRLLLLRIALDLCFGSPPLLLVATGLLSALHSEMRSSPKTGDAVSASASRAAAFHYHNHRSWCIFTVGKRDETRQISKMEDSKAAPGAMLCDRKVRSSEQPPKLKKRRNAMAVFDGMMNRYL